MQGEHHAGFACIFHLLFVKLAQGFFTHEHAVDNLGSLQGDFGFQDDCLAGFGDEFHADIACFVQRHGFLAMVEVAVFHVRHVRA